VPDFGLGNAAGRECISPWRLTYAVVGKASSGLLVLLCGAFLPLFACCWLVSVFVGHLKFSWRCLHNPASGMLCPVPAAAVQPGSVAQGERCPLGCPVGNELQLLLSSIPDASPLHRHYAVFGTESCYVSTE